MAGANGPTSAAGTVDTPNPKGGPAEQPDTGEDETKGRETPKDKPDGDQNEDG